MIRAGAENNTVAYDRTARDAVWFNITGAEHMIIACPDLYWVWMPSSAPTAKNMVQIICDYTVWFLNKHLKDSIDPIPNPQNYPLISNFKQK